MSKIDKDKETEPTLRQVEHTSAGGHLGGTYFGQEPDASTSQNHGRSRPSGNSQS